MNCKQGDLAVIVKSAAGNEGKIVTCVRLLGSMQWRHPDGRMHSCSTWEIDGVIKGWSWQMSNTIADDQLRPIRDNDGEDEMLRIAGLPNKQPEVVL